jgi:hypothetical protein
LQACEYISESYWPRNVHDKIFEKVNNTILNVLNTSGRVLLQTPWGPESLRGFASRVKHRLKKHLPEYRKVLFSIAEPHGLILHMDISLIVAGSEFNEELFEIVKAVLNGTIGFPVTKEYFFCNTSLYTSTNSQELINCT